jgi:trimethylamine--corrinoid protein Co-methyltransferase
LLSSLSGGNLVHDVGYINNGLTTSLEQLVVSDEVIGMVRRIVGGIEISEETMALSLIEEIGPGGNFLSHKHTLKHIRDEIHLAKLFDRTAENTWTKAGRRAVYQVAREKAEKILKEHYPQPLPKNTQARLLEILRQVEREQIKRA